MSAAATLTALDAAGGTNRDTADESHTAALPLFTRVRYGVFAFVLQNLLAPLSFISVVKRERFSATWTAKPDLVKTYPIRKNLPIRSAVPSSSLRPSQPQPRPDTKQSIFFPASYTGSKSGVKPAPGAATAAEDVNLPLLFTIHGGGFVIGSPPDNDAWNHKFASQHGFLVIGLNYAKAPGSPFPNALHDLEALITCVLADTSLPIDKARIAIAGWSAGGNLTLTVSQLPTIRPHIRAIIPIYPVTNFLTPATVKARTRRYKPSLGGFSGSASDYLLPLTDMFMWAYLPPGLPTHDTLMNPAFATREMLPPNVFIIGCELDMLGHEDWALACKLAGREVPGEEEVLGREEVGGNLGELVVEGDERFAFEEVVDGGRYRWLLVPDAVHGFDQDIEIMVRDEEVMQGLREKTEKVIGIVGEWLLSGPLKVGGV
ncbi:Alpha/Beta hydrolase protein [Podospora appendiculata]|uniref:Alpha/Beta hydrolase protein n=1 Tax=Podospora appendiculata TaxID=314037 RepID=A0AAE0XA82_9PEZI|nr:Alpha/Beta hydrolase protein [Podospora appendiculata]